MVGKGGVEYWVVEPFCYIWVLGKYGGCELAGVFLLDVGFEVYDG